jgi:hypothetical protein
LLLLVVGIDAGLQDVDGSGLAARSFLLRRPILSRRAKKKLSTAFLPRR